MSNCPDLRFSHSKNTTQYQSLHCLLIVAEAQIWTVAHATLLLALKYSGTLYHNIHIVSQEYSMLFTDFYVLI